MSFITTPAATRTWVDSVLDSIYPGAGVAYYTTATLEDYLLWTFGGLDAFGAFMLYMIPEWMLTYGYGYDLSRTDFATKAMITHSA